MSEKPERKVKGAILLPYQKLIKENKTLDWQQYLKDEDWIIINGKISHIMYPFETFQRCGLAAFNLVAKKNVKAVKFWAKNNAEDIFDVYRIIIEADNPIHGLDNFLQIRSTVLFNFNLFEAEIEKINDKHLKISSVSKVKVAEGVEAFTWQLMGWMEYIIEKTKGKNPKIEILAKEWEGAPKTILDITWQ